MEYSVTGVGVTPEILKRLCGGEYSKPLTVASSCFTSNDRVKAGTPMSASGTVANTSDAIGVLWNDVYKENPNGSVIVANAVINKTVAEAHSGITYSANAKSAMSHLIFE